MLGAEDVKKLELDQTPPQPQTEITDSEPKVNLVIPEEFSRYKVAEIFGLDRMKDVDQYSVEINRVMDYLKEVNAQTVDDIVFFTRSLASKLGNVPGENKLKTVSRYLFLSKERDEINKRIERLTQA
jgi:hypothetical protein